MQTINLQGSLLITNPVTIDGTTQPGFSDRPVIVLRGTGTGAGFNAVQLNASDSTVRGLVIQNFTGSGIVLAAGANDNRIQGN